MRATTAVNRILNLPGASVTGVRFAPEGVVVAVRLRRRRPLTGRGYVSAVYGTTGVTDDL